MFSKLALFAVASFAAIVAAIPSPGGEHGNTQICGTGPIQCCNSITSANNAVAKKVIEELGISAEVPVAAAVGLTCSPIANIAAGNSCVGQTACCQGNSFSGAVVVGCSPINL